MVIHDRVHSHFSNRTQENHFCRLKIFMIFMGIFLVAVVLPSYVLAIDISDEPLEVKILSAPPNIMFVLDNSESMDWEFMTDDADGKFEGTFEYLFDIDVNVGGVVLLGDDRKKWKSQWAGHNKIFFNPTVDYHPWPTKPTADTSTPRSNPENATPTLDLAAEYVTIGTIRINNAHYYVWDDADGDGMANATGEVYLVNFKEGGEREYYLFNDNNGDDIVDVGELELKTETEIPDSITPKFKDELGIETPKTDTEDLQNFANWVSFFRRRELTSKAAVATTINSLKEVQIGFYSINEGVRQSVLPVKVDPVANIIVDNLDSRYQESGNWAESSAANEYNDSSRYTSETDASATWTPDLPEAGTYNVYVWYTFLGTRDTNALYTINHSGQQPTTVRMNQKEFHSQWRLLGTFQFDAGSSGSVTVTRDIQSTGSSTSADAVMFERVDGVGLEDDKTGTLLSLLYGLDVAPGGTPLRNALKAVGQYFDQNFIALPDDELGDFKFATSAKGGACQQIYTVVMTDGFYNGETPGVGNVDKNEDPPYADTFSDTLADVAMFYYLKDLAPGLADEVPTNACDRATRQHMVTYTVSFGAMGTLTPPDDDPCFLNPTTPIPEWPNPESGDHEKIDDLWHASVNGRGLFFNVSPPEALIEALTNLFRNIVSRSGSGASVAVKGGDLTTSTVLYQATFNSEDWTGDVTAFLLNPSTGEIRRDSEGIRWKASNTLRDTRPNDRLIVTYDGIPSPPGIPFLFDNLTSDQKAALNQDPNMVDYLRGQEIIGFRPRTSKLGDIVHAAPLLVGNTLFVGANDGMLHAFNADNGHERFAYVPNLVFDKLTLLTKNDYEHEFFVDLTPVVMRGVGEAQITLLVGGLGKGGKGYYALNITTADTPEQTINTVADMVLWEYPGEGIIDDDLGFTYSRALIVRSHAALHEWVIIFGNGYDSTNGHAVLYILDAETGSLIKKIDTGVGGDNGLSTPALVSGDRDLIVEYAYAGDLKGNLWKFHLTDSDPANWEVAFGEDNNGDGTINFIKEDDPLDEDTPQPLFQATNQPITTKPDVLRHCERHGFIVVFGTGKFLSIDDRSNVEVQTLYGIWDYGDDEDPTEFLGSFDRTDRTLSNQPNNVTLLEQIVIGSATISGVEFRASSDFDPIWGIIVDTDEGQNPNPGSDACSDGKDNDGDGLFDEADEECIIVHAGWYFDLPSDGERIIKDLLIREGRAIVLSTIPTDSPCSHGGNSFLYEIDACTGGRLPFPLFDINYNIAVDNQDRINIATEQNPELVPPSGIGFAGILNPPAIIGGPGETEIKLFSSSSGAVEKVVEVGEKKGIYYWIER